ncbi:MAG: class I SAM-dependent methyltransferase [Myxococcales bacterium]|nr:class I SAM-dependent methyltransferase [Myxococcales bacterium]
MEPQGSEYFDRIADDYGVLDIANVPVRRYSQVYTLTRLVGDLTGKSVLELACSDGFFTRTLQGLGAARVVGVDLSEKMVALARRYEAARPLGIEYRVADVLDLGVIGSFDLVVSSFALHYAADRDALLRMCRVIHANLKPGGRLISINDNPGALPDSVDGFEKYGETKTVERPADDGARLTVEFVVRDEGSDERRVSFDCTYFTEDAFRWGVEAAGFRDVRFHAPQIAPEGIERFGQEYWSLVQMHPLHVYIEGWR